MKYLFILLLNIQLLATTNLNSDNKMYSFIYEFTNHSLGPINSISRAKIYMRSNKVISIINLKDGSLSKNILGIDKLLEVINNKNNNLSVAYDDNNFPKSIEPKSNKNLMGSKYIIKIKDLKIIDNIIISVKNERLNELNINENKWKLLDMKNYNYIYQDSRVKNIHKEGIKVTINQKKIIDAIDIRSFKDIKLSKFSSLLKIDNLFKIVKKSLKEDIFIEVLYDKKYGYPYLISLNNDNDKYQIVTRNLQKETLK